MLDPYKMVAVNIVSSFLLLCGILIYKFIFPRRKINLLYLFLLISILPIISIFRTGAYESGDFNIHIYRTIEFFKSLGEGNLMPSWAGSLNATYGYPLFIFNYSLPYYIISLFHWLGFSFIGSLKIFLGLNLILSGTFMFLFAKKLFRNDFPAFTTSIFYVFAPYHLIDVHFKIVIGEILFFTILPLTFLSLYKLQNNRTLAHVLLLALSFTALIMSHLAIALFAGVLMLFYILFHLSIDNRKTFILCSMIVFGISLLISLYSWLGPLLLSKYSFIQNIALGTVYFPTFQELLYSPWRMGLLFQGPKGEISFLLGYTHLFVIISFLIFLYKKCIPKKIFPEVLFWFISFSITVFFILPYSKSIWEFLPIIKIVGSHRLLIFTSFISSILAGYFTLILRKQWAIYILIVVTIGSTILNWGQRRVIPEITDSILQTNLWKSTSEGEAHFYANTRWADMKNPWFSELPSQPLEIMQGNGIVQILERTSTKHLYIVNAQTPITIKENTLYFPGWSMNSNDKQISIYPGEKGIIYAKLPKGLQLLSLTYEDILLYRITKIISIATFSISIILLIYLSLSKTKSSHFTF